MDFGVLLAGFLILGALGITAIVEEGEDEDKERIPVEEDEKKKSA
jgi:hypothetical protein